MTTHPRDIGAAARGLMAGDRQRMLDDWGTPVIVRVVQQTWTPATGQRQESWSEFTVRAIVRESEASPGAGTAGQHFEQSATFVFLACDWPAGGHVGAARVVHGGRVYTIAERYESADGGLLTIVGRSV